MLVVRVLRRTLLRTGAQTGPGSSGPWGQDPRAQARGQASYSRTVRSPYEVLEVRPGASQEEIATAFRKLVQQYHPDKVVNLGPELRELAEQRMKEINGAYEQLKRYGPG